MNRIVDPISHGEAMDMRKHMRFIESIAEEMQQSIQEIVPLYDEVLEALRARARIEDYLPILVAKRVRRILRRQRPTTEQGSRF
jgi:hypothetical protein